MHFDNAKAQAEAQAKRKHLSEKEDKLAAKVNKGPKVLTNKVKKVKVGDEVYVPCLLYTSCSPNAQYVLIVL